MNLESNRFWILAQPLKILETLAKVPNLTEHQSPISKNEENYFYLQRSPWGLKVTLYSRSHGANTLTVSQNELQFNNPSAHSLRERPGWSLFCMHSFISIPMTLWVTVFLRTLKAAWEVICHLDCALFASVTFFLAWDFSPSLPLGAIDFSHWAGKINLRPKTLLLFHLSPS